MPWLYVAVRLLTHTLPVALGFTRRRVCQEQDYPGSYSAFWCARPCAGARQNP